MIARSTVSSRIEPAHVTVDQLALCSRSFFVERFHLGHPERSKARACFAIPGEL
jgi:hypothetical protein